MDEVEDRCSADPAPSADNPLEMRQDEATRMIGWLLDLRRQFLHQHHSLELGADRRDVTIAYLGEVLKFMGRDRVLRPLLAPLAELAFALEDGTRSSLAAYLKPAAAVAAGAAPTSGRPPLDSTRRLRGVVAFLVEVLRAGGAFGAREAADKVAEALNTAGCLMPIGGKFKSDTVTDWHERVVYRGRRTELERDVYDALKLDLKQRHPEHVGWDHSRLESWLTETVRHLARTGLKNFVR